MGGDQAAAFVIYLSILDASRNYFCHTHMNSNWWERDLAEWSERCASIPKITGSNPSFVLICCRLRQVAVRERSLSLPVCRVAWVTHFAFSV
jgi:hypothetical protein